MRCGEWQAHDTRILGSRTVKMKKNNNNSRLRIKEKEPQQQHANCPFAVKKDQRL